MMRSSAQDSADRPMGKIGEDQFVEQASMIENRRSEMSGYQSLIGFVD
jgi:hypothetical protein